MQSFVIFSLSGKTLIDGEESGLVISVVTLES